MGSMSPIAAAFCLGLLTGAVGVLVIFQVRLRLALRDLRRHRERRS